MILEGKVAIITGAASGIGRATAILFAKEGAKVAVADINDPGGMETVKLIQEEGKEAIFVHTDVSKDSDVQKMVQKIMDSFRRIDVLVNNAGKVLVKPLSETTEEDFNRVVANFKSVFLCTKHVLPNMKRRGSIVNVASISGHVGEINHAVYGGTKGAIISITRALAWELAPLGIRVNSVSPGSVETPMLLGDIKGEAKRRGVSKNTVRKETEEKVALKRWAKPEEIAHGILFLASDEASYVNGIDLLIDGGEAAG